MSKEFGRAAAVAEVSDEAGAVPFGTTFVKSEAFRALFRDGMALVEETAGYLDGDGREQSNRLGRAAALAYASESMRLTTRLMQIASWLLVQRAVAEGEITPTQAQREKERVKLSSGDGAAQDAHVATLPEPMQGLVAQSVRLHARIRHLDKLMSRWAETDGDRTGPVLRQHQLLRSVFEVV